MLRLTNCEYCGKHMPYARSDKKFCSLRHGRLFRNSGNVSRKQKKDNYSKDFIKEMLGVEGNTISFKIESNK